jgi:hypothetical protein
MPGTPPLSPKFGATQMYDDLNQIAQLRFNKERESISGQTRDKVREMRNEYASTSGPGLRSGPAEAAICQAQIDGTAQIVEAFCKIWVGLIERLRIH